ncbi:hypothetical protein OHA21_34275 [Actinoplanes sp. NBC_00393]|uniref:hypothetical protein n=1 Tax=Actinoplanes sp. NBC_00393 TaxID=2975953 RepID=UPI002E205B51
MSARPEGWRLGGWARHLVAGPGRRLVTRPGPWSLGRGAWSLGPGTWSLGPGTWSLGPGTWSLGPGARVG